MAYSEEVSEKVGVKLFSKPGFNSRFQSCVWESETPEEFEYRWSSIIRDFELDRVEWLAFMYGIPDKWVPAYFMDVFLARMRRTQCAEAMNSFFHNFGRILYEISECVGPSEAT